MKPVFFFFAGFLGNGAFRACSVFFEVCFCRPSARSFEEGNSARGALVVTAGAFATEGWFSDSDFRRPCAPLTRFCIATAARFWPATFRRREACFLPLRPLTID